LAASERVADFRARAGLEICRERRKAAPQHDEIGHVIGRKLRERALEQVVLEAGNGEELDQL
jgi:hypothetical protein